MKLYHVTKAENAAAIRRDGFLDRNRPVGGLMLRVGCVSNVVTALRLSALLRLRALCSLFT